MKRTLAQREDRASYSAKREKIVKATGPVLKRYGHAADAGVDQRLDGGAGVLRYPGVVGVVDDRGDAGVQATSAVARVPT